MIDSALCTCERSSVESLHGTQHAACNIHNCTVNLAECREGRKPQPQAPSSIRTAGMAWHGMALLRLASHCHRGKPSAVTACIACVRRTLYDVLHAAWCQCGRPRESLTFRKTSSAVTALSSSTVKPNAPSGSSYLPHACCSHADGIRHASWHAQDAACDGTLPHTKQRDFQDRDRGRKSDKKQHATNRHDLATCHWLGA